MRYPIYVDGNVPMQAIADALAPHGFHLRIENGCRMVVDPIPSIVRKDAPAAEAAQSEVVRMPPRIRQVK